MTSRRVAAVAIAAILIIAGLVDNGSGTERAIAPAVEADVVLATDLAALGPVRLINNSYTMAMTFGCSTDTGFLSGSISIGDVLANPNGVVLSGATFTSNGANSWFAGPNSFGNGTATWTWVSFSSLSCVTANNPAGIVSLTLSNGDHYVVTINAIPD